MAIIIMSISPKTNDRNWAAYFASTNTKYLDLIIANLKYLEERVDQNKFFTASSAEWSLRSNAEQHKDVLTYLELVQFGNPKVAALLKKDRKEMLAESRRIFLEQVSKGIWK